MATAGRLRQYGVLVLAAGAEPPARWPLARCALVVPLLAGAAGPLLTRCRAATVAARCLLVRPDWTAVSRAGDGEQSREGGGQRGGGWETAAVGVGAKGTGPCDGAGILVYRGLEHVY